MPESIEKVPNDNTHRLAGDKIFPLLIKFSLPATIGTVLNATYNITDRIFIGRAIGEDGLAAATISFPMMMIIIAFGMMFGHGSCALISIRLGQGNKPEAEKILGQSFALFAILSVCFTFFGLIFIEPLLTLFGASPNILPLAVTYARVILWGIFAHEISFGINSLIRGEGNIKASMVTMILGAVLNMILDPIFLFVLDMGIRGAAIATVISQIISASWVMYYYLSNKSFLRLQFKNIKIYPTLARQVIATGCPPFLMNSTACITQAIIYNSLGHYGGDTEIAVMGVIFTLLMLTFMPMIGLNHGTQPIIGFNYGAKNYQRVRHTAILTLIISTGICLLMYLVINLIPQLLFMPFSSNSDFINTGAAALRKFMLLMPMIGTIFVTTNYFQAIARPKISILLSMIRQVLILVPAVLIMPLFLGVNGIWYSGPASDCGAFIAAVILISRELKRLKVLSEPE
ncbi:MAG: MATE family efflux transporter [Sedimentisphaeraceae bacterium JB056]